MSNLFVFMSNMILPIYMMINVNTKILSAINFHNIGSIYGYLNGAIRIIGGKGYTVRLLEVK